MSNKKKKEGGGAGEFSKFLLRLSSTAESFGLVSSLISIELGSFIAHVYRVRGRKFLGGDQIICRFDSPRVRSKNFSCFNFGTTHAAFDKVFIFKFSSFFFFLFPHLTRIAINLHSSVSLGSTQRRAFITNGRRRRAKQIVERKGISIRQICNQLGHLHWRHAQLV